MRQGRFTRLIRSVQGSVAIVSALGLLAFVGAASLAIDMGQLYTVRNELQNTTDSAALAAAGNLIVDQGGVAVRDATGAQTAAMNVAQRQAALQNLAAVSPGDRNDVTILFGVWDVNAGNPDTAWTEIGPTCGSSSNANAVKVTLLRAAGLNYGPVTNMLAGIFGDSSRTSQVTATAIAYLGYTNSTQTGTVKVPLALPDTVLTASRQGESNWLAQLFSPSEAIASGPTSLTFKDLGSDTFYQNNLGKPQFATAKAYLFLVNNSDATPDTVINNIKKNYTSGTAVRNIALGTRLYPISEYQWASNIKTIFQTLQQAYNAKKNSSGKWRVCVPVYNTQTPVAQRLLKGVMDLARVFSLGPSEAQACFTFWTQSYPGGNVPVYVNGFANVDITGVNYVSTCDDCSPYAPAADHKNYLSTLDCMVKSSLSCRNANSVTVEVPVSNDTVSPPGSLSGQPNYYTNPSNPTNPQALATIPRLVK